MPPDTPGATIIFVIAVPTVDAGMLYDGLPVKVSEPEADVTVKLTLKVAEKTPPAVPETVTVPGCGPAGSPRSGITSKVVEPLTAILLIDGVVGKPNPDDAATVSGPVGFSL